MDTYAEKLNAALKDAERAERLAGMLEELGDDEWEEVSEIQDALPWNLRTLARTIRELTELHAELHAEREEK